MRHGLTQDGSDDGMLWMLDVALDRMLDMLLRWCVLVRVHACAIDAYASHRMCASRPSVHSALSVTALLSVQSLHDM